MYYGEVKGLTLIEVTTRIPVVKMLWIQITILCLVKIQIVDTDIKLKLIDIKWSWLNVNIIIRVNIAYINKIDSKILKKYIINFIFNLI